MRHGANLMTSEGEYLGGFPISFPHSVTYGVRVRKGDFFPWGCCLSYHDGALRGIRQPEVCVPFVPLAEDGSTLTVGVAGGLMLRRARVCCI